jgi:hypothetical protein
MTIVVCGVCLASTTTYGEEPVYSESQIRALAGNGHFVAYTNNPVVPLGTNGQWDAGALGSPTVLKVGKVFHMYYEAWGVRGNHAWSQDEYNSLQIGHATSEDGVHWTKDPANPVLPKGAGNEWDKDGTWDPFVIYEDGVFKMWYGGGNKVCDWGYAVSKDGTHFEKKGQISRLGHVEDDHVVHDKASGRYFMYYWDRKHEPMGLFRAESTNETDFAFTNATRVRIAGLIEGKEYPEMYKFTHVIQEGQSWHMFYAKFVRPGCKNCKTGYATSSDGLNWTAQNTNVFVGQDGELLKLADDLWLMFYGPDGYFDQAKCDIRVALFKGKLDDLAGISFRKEKK